MESTSSKLDTRQRSVGVTVFGIIFILFSLYGILLLFTYFFMAFRFHNTSIIISEIITNLRLWILPLIYTLFLPISIGIFKLQSWARKLAILLSTIIVIFYIIFIPISINAARQFAIKGLKEAMMQDTISMILIIALFLFIICFFNLSKIKEQFK